MHMVMLASYKGLHVTVCGGRASPDPRRELLLGVLTGFAQNKHMMLKWWLSWA